MGIFGRRKARRRLRSAARQSLLIPAFSPPIDCTPWVIGGLWPTELSEVTTQNAMVAEYLNADLQRIANSANERIRNLGHADMAGSARQAEEERVIKHAREFAAHRVESTVRQMRDQALQRGAKGPAVPEPTTAVLRPVHESPEPVEAPAHTPAAEPGAGQAAEVNEPRTDKPPPPSPKHAAVDVEPTPVAADSGHARLQRLLAFVARQQPELRWAVGDRADGTTLVATDLAHGWIPPGIALPTGVRLLEPGPWGGNLTALLGPTTSSATYYPPAIGFGWATDFAPTESSVQPRELPAIGDLGWLLGAATHGRDGLPRLAHTLAKAGAAGTGILDREADLLRVHLDTARYQLLTQYPDVKGALLLNCLLLAATERIAAGDTISTNYHLAWFQALSAPPPGSGDVPRH